MRFGNGLDMNIFLRCVVLLNLVWVHTSFANEVQERVDIVSYGQALLPHEDNIARYRSVRERFDVHFTHNLYKYVQNFQGDSHNLKKIIFLDYCEDPRMISLPKHKMICFKWEAVKTHPRFYDYYYRVYTFDDDLVDNKKFFKFYYPVLQPMLSSRLAFNEKKLCVMVASNWNSERVRMLDFFATKPQGSLDVYGKVPQKYQHHQMNKGRIPGRCSGTEKVHTLKKYRFCIYFENTHTTPGYITEKIFDAFAAGCVPIYWGPENVEKYIPLDCIIDYRKFRNKEQMYQYINSMQESEYEEYINRIGKFLKSKQAYLFSQEYFDKLLLKAVTDA